MSAALFFVGFLAAGIVGTSVLTNYDPEPIGAFASLLLLSLAASVTSAVSYLACSRRLHRFPGGLAGLLGGLVSAATFCASAGLLYVGLGFVASVCLAFVLAATVASVWPFLSTEMFRKG
jgi:hypothetical protein